MISDEHQAGSKGGQRSLTDVSANLSYLRFLKSTAILRITQNLERKNEIQ